MILNLCSKLEMLRLLFMIFDGSCVIVGEAAVPGANKQKNMAAERKNRRALGDIGNMVTVRGVDGKPLPQVSRPVTR